MIENKLKTNKEEGNLGEERYQIIAFAIFGLVLFPSEAAEIISIEAANAFDATILFDSFTHIYLMFCPCFIYKMT